MVYIKHQKHIPFEYNKITEYIFIGTDQCCQIHFNKKLLKKGIKADISLQKEKLDSPYGVDYFLWIPVKDKTAPSQKQLLIGAKAIKNFVDNKVKVYIHCQRGHGRAPTLVAAYFILEGYSVEKARKIIKKKRPGSHLNQTQVNALKRFEVGLK
jgi:protein tyrosine phosphatase